MPSEFSQWTWASEESEYRCPGGIFECNPYKAACAMDFKTSRRFCCDYGGVCWTEDVRCGGPDTFRIQREDENPFCCMKDRERPDPNRGGACFSTLDNPLVDIPAKELQAAYTRALDAGAKPTDGPSFDPFNLNPKPAPETTSSSKKAPSTSSPAPEPTPEEPAPDPENEETTASISPSPSTTTSHTPAKTSDSAFQGGRSDEDDDEDNRENSTGTFDLTSPLATETFSSPGGYLGGSSDSTLQETSNNGLSTGALAGAVVAGVVGGLLIAVGIFFLLRRKKHQKRALNGGGPNGEMIDESNEPRASDPTNTNPNHPLEIMGVTLMFKKPKNQPITFGSDAESITDIAPTSQTSRASHSQSPSRTELGAAVPVEAQSAPVVELSASKSQRWRTE